MDRSVRWMPGPEALFLVSSAVLCTAELAILAHPGFWKNPGVVATAVTADLALGLPLLGYLFLVRTRRTDGAILLPLFFVGLFLARWFIPNTPQTSSLAFRGALAVAEGGLLAFLGLRIRRIRSTYLMEKRRQPYASDALFTAFTRILGTRLGGAVFGEGAAFWYALAGWGPSRQTHTGGRLFPGFRRNAYPAVLGAILMAVMAETAVIHLLVSLWNRRVAWILTALGVYTVLWLLGDLHAARKNQTLASDFGLHLRMGLRWRADVPWTQIRSLHTDPPQGKSVRMTMMGKPDFWIELQEPQVVHGILGLERKVAFLGLGLDDPEAFRRLVEEKSSLVA